LAEQNAKSAVNTALSPYTGVVSSHACADHRWGFGSGFAIKRERTAIWRKTASSWTASNPSTALLAFESAVSRTAVANDSVPSFLNKKGPPAGGPLI
jgi:hypothetical protein